MNGDTPVLLGMDGPDCGGLLCILGIVGSDWWKLGQMAAGDKFRFVLPSTSDIPSHVAKQKKWLEAVKGAGKSASSAGVSPFPVDVETKPQPVTDGVIKVVEGDAALDAPKLTFRLAGDGGILIEVGEQDLFFRTRLIVELWERRLKAKENKGEYFPYVLLPSLLTTALRSLHLHSGCRLDARQVPPRLDLASRTP
jgi:hypothetical protein